MTSVYQAGSLFPNVSFEECLIDHGFIQHHTVVEKKFLMESKVPVINERIVLIVLIVPPVSPPLLASVLLVRSEKANTVSSVK